MSILYFFFSDNRLPDVSKRDEREKKQIDIERERATKWANMMNRDKIRKFFEPQAKYREKMITRIYKGVPDMVRGQLWYILLDIGKKYALKKYDQFALYTITAFVGAAILPH